MNRERNLKTCLHCGYDRTGLEAGVRCPECGGAAPAEGPVRYLDQPITVLARTSVMLWGVVILQLLTLVVVVAIFMPSPPGFWLVIAGLPIVVLNLLLRSSKRLHASGSARLPGSLVVGMLLVVLTGILAVGFFGVWGSMGLAIPVLLASWAVLGVRGSISSSRWIEDDLAEGFQQYSIWPAVIAAITAVASLWTGRSWDVVTIFTLGFLGWWVVQIIGDLILAWTGILAIGHRHKLDGIESRKQAREDGGIIDR